MPHNSTNEKEILKGFTRSLQIFATRHPVLYTDSDEVLGKVSVKNSRGVDMKEHRKPRSLSSLVGTAL